MHTVGVSGVIAFRAGMSGQGDNGLEPRRCVELATSTFYPSLTHH